MRKLIFALTSLACLVLATAAMASTANTFKTVCNVGTTNKGPSPQYMDPIKFPGQYPVGHSHEFGGNVHIGPSQGGSALINAGLGTLPDGSTGPIHTTCENRFDTASEWFPTLYVDSGFGFVRVAPQNFYFDIYYETPPGQTASDGTPFTAMNAPPTDMRLIGGNSKATGPQPIDVVKWHCLGGDSRVGTTPPACPDSTTGSLGVTIVFPNCWDGSTDKLANGTSNVVYTSPVVNNATHCPAGNDVPVSRIVLSPHYGFTTLPDCHRIVPPDTPQLGFNCVNYAFADTDANGNPIVGTIWTAHADWLNGWNRTTDTIDNPPDDLPSLVGRFNLTNGASCDETCSATKDANGNPLPGDAFTGIDLK